LSVPIGLGALRQERDGADAWEVEGGIGDEVCEFVYAVVVAVSREGEMRDG
jgi:hypothetical protein